ncbi:hypothetical protein BC937DRAFT_86528, partial [Endogone sp. FLAS-F59071]
SYESPQDILGCLTDLPCLNAIIHNIVCSSRPPDPQLEVPIFASPRGCTGEVTKDACFSTTIKFDTCQQPVIILDPHSLQQPPLSAMSRPPRQLRNEKARSPEIASVLFAWR